MPKSDMQPHLHIEPVPSIVATTLTHNRAVDLGVHSAQNGPLTFDPMSVAHPSALPEVNASSDGEDDSRIGKIPNDQGVAVPQASVLDAGITLKEMIDSIDAADSAAPIRVAEALDRFWIGRDFSAKFNSGHMLSVASALRKQTDRDGRVTPALQSAVARVENDHGERFTANARDLWISFLARIGAKTALKIGVPKNDIPYWQEVDNPFAGWGAEGALPREIDVVIIGGGLTGASAARHVLKLNGQKRNFSVAIFEKSNAPATQSSGRNGGNFQVIPENALGFKAFHGLVRLLYHQLRLKFPKKTKKQWQTAARHIAGQILSLTVRNADIFKQTVDEEKMDVDFSGGGVLRVAEAGSQVKAMQEDHGLGRNAGIEMRMVPPLEVDAALGLPKGAAQFGGLWSEGGNYHPVKYVIGLLRSAIRDGAGLYTRTNVERIQNAGSAFIVETNRGPVVAKRVIVATDASTSDLFPELGVTPHKSQIAAFRHLPDVWSGKTVTAHNRSDGSAGGIYAQQPRGSVYRDERGVQHATLLFGGGPEFVAEGAADLRVSHSTHRKLLEQIGAYFPEAVGVPPYSEWVGLIGHTRDQLPVIGTLRKNLVVAAGFCGYGGSWTQVAAFVAAHVAVFGFEPEWFLGVRDILAPNRFLPGNEWSLSDVLGGSPATNRRSPKFARNDYGWRLKR